MTVKKKIVAINKLLLDIYQREMRLSYLLSEMHFTEDDLELISNQLLTETIDNFINALKETLLNCHDGKRLFEILHDFLGLDGNTPKTLQNIGNELKISRERVRQLKEKALKKLKATNNRANLENSFKNKNIKLLQQNLNRNNLSSFNEDSKNLNLPIQHTFKINQSKEGVNYIIIFDGKENNSINNIKITEGNFQDFYNELMTTINLLCWKCHLKVKKSYNMDNIRQKHQRAYEKWTIEEDKLLFSKFEQGIDVKEIATILERQPSAINSRLKKLGLK